MANWQFVCVQEWLRKSAEKCKEKLSNTVIDWSNKRRTAKKRKAKTEDQDSMISLNSCCQQQRLSYEAAEE